MIRRVLAGRGEMRFIVDVAPRLDYARARHEIALTPHDALFRSPELDLSLSTRCPLEIVDGRDVRARIELRAGQTATFVLDRVQPVRCRGDVADREETDAAPEPQTVASQTSPLMAPSRTGTAARAFGLGATRKRPAGPRAP